MNIIIHTFTASDIFQGEGMTVCHDGIALTVGKGKLQVFKSNVRRQNNSAGTEVNSVPVHWVSWIRWAKYAADGNSLVNHPGAAFEIIVDRTLSPYFDDIAIVGIRHDFVQIRDVVSHAGRSGLPVHGQGRPRKRRHYDANRQQSRRDTKSHFVIQNIPPVLLQALSLLPRTGGKFCCFL